MVPGLSSDRSSSNEANVKQKKAPLLPYLDLDSRFPTWSKRKHEKTSFTAYLAPHICFDHLMRLEFHTKKVELGFSSKKYRVYARCFGPRSTALCLIHLYSHASYREPSRMCTRVYIKHIEGNEPVTRELQSALRIYFGGNGWAFPVRPERADANLKGAEDMSEILREMRTLNAKDKETEERLVELSVSFHDACVNSTNEEIGPRRRMLLLDQLPIERDLDVVIEKILRSPNPFIVSKLVHGLICIWKHRPSFTDRDQRKGIEIAGELENTWSDHRIDRDIRPGSRSSREVTALVKLIDTTIVFRGLCKEEEATKTKKRARQNDERKNFGRMDYFENDLKEMGHEVVERKDRDFSDEDNEIDDSDIMFQRSGQEFDAAIRQSRSFWMRLKAQQLRKKKADHPEKRPCRPWHLYGEDAMPYFVKELEKFRGVERRRIKSVDPVTVYDLLYCQYKVDDGTNVELPVEMQDTRAAERSFDIFRRHEAGLDMPEFEDEVTAEFRRDSDMYRPLYEPEYGRDDRRRSRWF